MFCWFLYLLSFPATNRRRIAGEEGGVIGAARVDADGYLPTKTHFDTEAGKLHYLLIINDIYHRIFMRWAHICTQK